MKYIVECEKTIKRIYVVDAENDEQCHDKLVAGEIVKKFERDSTKSYGFNYGGYYYKNVESHSDEGEDKVICSVNDLCEYLGTTPDRLKRDMFKYTDCGMPIAWDDDKVTLFVYAEGADSEWSYDLFFPFTAGEFYRMVAVVEEESDKLWHEWNDDDEEEEDEK